jgi:hypothetical protein
MEALAHVSLKMEQCDNQATHGKYIITTFYRVWWQLSKVYIFSWTHPKKMLLTSTRFFCFFLF